MLVVDGFAVFLNALFLVSGFAGMALAYDYNRRMDLDRGEYYVLLLFSISGMMLMASAADLIVVFLALELLSIPLYVLAGFAHPKAESEEAALKYFLLGAFAGGFVVYGVALVFGATGTTALAGITAAIAAGTADLSLMVIGAALILVGFAFKVAVVPFQMWTPDVYQGAPTCGDSLYGCRCQSGWFRSSAAGLDHSFPRPGSRPDPHSVDPGSPDDDYRELRRHRPEQYQAHAGLFQHRPRRLYLYGSGDLRAESA